jgi:hypothetical protein
MQLIVGALLGAATALHAQRPAAATPVADYRTSPAPATHLSGGRTCPVTFGATTATFPEGLQEVYSATRLANGNVAVFDAKAGTLYVFDRAGALITRAGRRGRGPGEFGSVLPVVYPYRGDSLLVDDPMVRTMHVFDHNGKFGRTVVGAPRDARAGTLAMVGASATDGSTIWTRTPLRPPHDGVEAYRDSITLLWRDARGDERARSAVTEDVFIAHDITRTPIPPLPGRTGVSFRSSMRAVAAGPVSHATGAWGGSASGSIAARTGPVYHVEEAIDALAIYAPDGTLARRVLLPPLDPKLRPSLDRVRPVTDAQLLEIFSDNLGRAWVEVVRDKLDGDRRWWIIDADGRWVATADTPPTKDKILEFGSDYMLVVKKDADDVQTVALCNIGPAR